MNFHYAHSIKTVYYDRQDLFTPYLLARKLKKGIDVSNLSFFYTRYNYFAVPRDLFKAMPRSTFYIIFKNICCYTSTPHLTGTRCESN